MRRVALLGATGSIGRQALEIIGDNTELELVAAASGSQAVDGLAPFTQVGGDLTALLERAEPDVVLNAVVGFAGLPATLWALERGVDLALANKESLVAGGDLCLAVRERGGGRLLPVDSEHSAALQCLEGRELATVDSLVLTASGGLFAGDGRARRRDARAGAGPPHLEHGPQDHDRFGHAREQGARADRGALPLRASIRPDRGRGAPAVDRPCPRPLPRRRLARASRLSGHARADLVRPDLPRAGGNTRPRTGSLPGTTLAFDAPDLDVFPLLRLARESGERGGTYPCVYNAANEVAVAAFRIGRLGFLDIASVVEEALANVDGALRGISTS